MIYEDLKYVRVYRSADKQYINNIFIFIFFIVFLYYKKL